MQRNKLTLAITLLFFVKTCLSQNFCTTSYCLYGDCEFLGNGPICHCNEGVKGQKCDDLLLPTDNPCLSNPCWNAGVCSPNGRDFRCDCKNGYTGKDCRTALSGFCSTKPCKNNGVCVLVSPAGDYSCSCINFWTGKNCETRIPFCERPEPCLNGGKCVNNRCDCPTNFIGDICQTYSPAPRTVKVLNKGGYIAKLRLSYELPITTINGQSGYETVQVEKSITLGRTATFQIPFNVNLDSANGAKLYAKAVAGRVIFNERITTDPKCFHVWGTTLTVRWSSMPC